ncbi:phosphatidylserine lipase ABHD16A isoform X1 [Xylocopa sonorina]|uniref:phosphatidylserine lipase ABHD16A isoform X1 n=2 Tax=Xylocopa sonorina TaxID=1818115 RepID=UPI00403A9182
MSFILKLWKFNFGPRLYNIYEEPWEGRLISKPYKPNIIERLSDQIVVYFAAIWSISLYTIPLVAIFFYQNSNYMTPVVSSWGKLVARASTILFLSLATRGFSRAVNPVYLKFWKTLSKANICYNNETKRELDMYDFEYWAKPIDFKMSSEEKNVSKYKLIYEKIAASSRPIKRQTGKEFIFTLPCKFLSYIVAHTFAIKMIYPGSISLLNWGLRSTLLKGRINLIIKYGGERYKLLTVDKNEIDAIFVDQRNRTTKGNILVITCEGNCGFYETGIISTPLNKGYSILGWNHPGFGSSTGAPYPLQEENAIDCVMRFAIDQLRFPEKQIILYGWSIGGYPATWAAMNYPSIQSLILDATFDDILPLAIMTMSLKLEGLVRNIIRDYFNLNIAEQLNRYNGTVLLIRRTEDEIVCTPSSNTLLGNRGNMLLIKLLTRRYPYLFTKSWESYPHLMTFLAADASTRESMIQTVKANKKQYLELVAADIEKSGGTVQYPSTLGQDCDSKTKEELTLFLITMYMKDQASSHCAPLALNLFQPGWDPMSVTFTKE